MAERTERSYEPLTNKNLARLVDLADRDHASFTRASGNQHAYTHRRVAVVLAQGEHSTTSIEPTG
jgi:hypothetical protein